MIDFIIFVLLLKFQLFFCKLFLLAVSFKTSLCGTRKLVLSVWNDWAKVFGYFSLFFIENWGA